MADPAASAAAAADSGAIVSVGNREAWTPRFGDMVWGKVKSHPWWPGHVYSITLSDDPEVHRGHREGLVLVAFFGDGSYGWFEPHELVRFEDHFIEKTSQGGSRTFPGAVAESLDEIARRSALAFLCPCRGPETFRPHNEDPRFLLVNVPGFDCNAEYLPDQVTAARERIVPQTMLDFLHNAAVEQRDAAEMAARTLPGIELAAMLMGYRRSRFERYDITYAESFGVGAEKALEAEKKTEAERSDRARPLKGRQRVPLPEKENQPAARGRRGAAGAAARLMEKIVPGAPAMKPRASKKDQYLLKRRDDARAAPTLALAVLPDAAAPAQDDGVPPGSPQADPQTPPLPGSGGAADEEFLLQRRAVPPVVAGQASDGGATADPAPAPKKAAKPKKVRKREREEPADGAAGAAAAAADEPKKKKKKKQQLNELNAGMAAAAAPAAPSGAGAKPAAFSPPKVDLDGVDLKQVISDLQNLPLLPSYGAGLQISDASHSFVLAFRSKYYKKSYENDPPEESKKSLENRPSAADSTGATAGGQPPKPAKKKPPMRPSDPTKAGVKRGPSDRQEELAAKKKIKLDKIKTLASDKKAAVEQKESAAAAAAGGAPAAQQPRAGMKEKPQAAARKKVPAAPAPAPAKRTASPTALMMKFPLKSTLPSVASLKARFARFGPLDIDGIRVYWKSHMCRVIYRFQSDAEVALKYAKSNAMFGQVLPNYYLRGVESESAGGGDPGLDAPPPQQRSDLRLMETAPFRPGSSGNGTPLALSRAASAHAAVGQQPKSILKKNSDDGTAGASLRYSPRVKFMLDDGDSKLEPPALPTSGAGSITASDAAAAAAPVSKSTRSVGFVVPPPAQPLARPPQQPHLQPPMRPQQQPLQPPRPPVTQPFPPPQQQQHMLYQPRVNDGLPSLPGQASPYAPRQHTDAPPPSFSVQPPPYQPRHSDGLLALPGQPPLLPYPPRQHYPPRSSDMPPSHATYSPGHGHNGGDTPAWKRGEKEFREELMRVMLGIAKLVEPLMDKNGNFPYHLFGRSA